MAKTKRMIIYVSPQGKFWAVKKEGAKRPTRVFLNKANAIKEGKIVARKQEPSQLKIQKKDDAFQTEFTYGKDPYPPKGQGQLFLQSSPHILLR